LRSWRFWTASGPFALALLAQVGFIVHQIAFLEPALGRGAAGLAVAVTAVMAVVGRVGLGTIIDRLDPRTATALSLLTQAAALGVMTQATGAGVLFAACAVFGLSVGNLITFPALVIQREFDAASFGMLMALASATCQTIFAFGPGLLGLVRDLTGGYAAALALCIALELVAAAVALLGRPKSAA
jgi:cyanate permease